MSISDADFARWARSVKKPCVLVELDYMYQVGIGGSATPTLGTLYVSNFPYIDEEGGTPIAYDDVLLSVPALERSLDPSTLRGAVAVNIAGSLVINNANARWDGLLYLCIDGSECRVYVGDPSWGRSDFRLLYTAIQAKASAATKQQQIEVSLRDVGMLLNKSIGGTVTVGGSGPYAEKFRPLPFGYVHNMAPLLIETSPSFKYAYSDRGTNCSAQVVRADGVALTGGGVDYTDNADGTFTLVNNPQGAQITCDVLLYPSGGASTDYRMSDAIEFFVGGESGLTALGKFGGAHGTYFDSGSDVPFNDYHCQTLLTERTNVIAWLEDAMSTVNGFWSTKRTGEFYYGRMRPEALGEVISLSAGRLSVAAEITSDAIVRDSIRLDHRLPTYASYQCVANVNQEKQTTFAGTLTADERAQLERDGYHSAAFYGEEVGTTQYLGSVAGKPYQGGAPELYHLSLSDSQLVSTLISGPDDSSAPDPATGTTIPQMQAGWNTIRRSQFLPWTEFVDFECSLEFYDLEIGDIPNLTYPRFDLTGGALHQVYKIGFNPMRARMTFGLVRRRFGGVSGPLPDYLLTESSDPIVTESSENILAS